MTISRVLGAVGLATVLLAGAGGTAFAAGVAQRGTVVSATPVAGLEAGEVRDYLARWQLDGSRVRFGVDATRVEYRTIDPWGRATTASELVVLPRGAERRPRQATWLHGTTADRRWVASVSDGHDRAAAIFFASAGYVTSAPDYLGLGTGPGFHPYVDVRSTATASVDALQATRRFVAGKHLVPQPDVLVSGHSQGGLSTMVVARALQQGAAPGLRLGGLAPISGPLHPTREIDQALSGDIANGVAYLAYWVTSWNRLHHLYDTPAEAFRNPEIPALFDGEHTHDEIFGKLPATVPELFTPAFLEKLRHPGGALAAALREADGTCDWNPRPLVHLYASGGDRDVPLYNSTDCLLRLREHHGRGEVIDLGSTVDHGTAVKLALPRILRDLDRG
ncbi:hypothetical protein D5S17_13180 [Pseudonocardiaceae bacterium YIM PH 21723]|nr:hypothetical protein D5S17_13180 [Pseudonocardiaceae bacterium YIM PH 21723]